MSNYEHKQSTEFNDDREVKQSKLSRRGLLTLGAVGVATGAGLAFGIPEYQKRKAEAEKLEAKDEYISQTNDIAYAMIENISDPTFSVDGTVPHYSYDTQTGLLVLKSADRDYGMNGLANVSITYQVADQEVNLNGVDADVLHTTVQNSQPTRLEVYSDSSFGGTINYIVMDDNGEVFYNHAFGNDNFENPYADLPATDINSIQDTLTTAHTIITDEESMFY